MSRFSARVRKLEEEAVTQNQICLIGNFITTTEELRSVLENMPPSTGLPTPSSDDFDDKQIERDRLAINKICELESLLSNKESVFVEEYQAILTRKSLDEMKQEIAYWPVNTGVNQERG